MKLAELLNVDTTKENWFKLLSKKGINPKTVSAVSKGGGEGIKEYYYKVLNDANLDTLILQLCNIKRAICKFRLETDEELVYKETAVWHYLTINNISDSIAFVINDEEPIVISQPDSSARIQASYLAKGNLINRVIQYRNIIGGQSLTEEQAQSILEPMVKEITKEEYESLITP